jgi:hypothetical protein
MSELIVRDASTAKVRRQLLITASAGALLCAASAVPATAQGDEDRATVWIEVGGQLERANSSQEIFSPAFTSQFLPDRFLQPGRLERLPRYSAGLEGAIHIEPQGTSWNFGVSVRYGRSNTGRSSHNQIATPEVLHGIISIPAFHIYRTATGVPAAVRFADAAFRGNESHLLLDFTAGRDVGLGGAGNVLSFNVGVRVAQFTSKSHVNFTANPGGVVPYKYSTQFLGQPAYIHAPNAVLETWDLYHASASISRSFRGLGPSLSLEDSIPLVGRPDTMRVDFDFGANGALLFGRQKVAVHHKSDDDRPIVPHSENFKPMTPHYHYSYNPTRSRFVVVPNVGGFAGLSFNYANAKLKLGYRADFFFGAMDGGIDTRKTYDRNFYGPFATISIGLRG